MKSERKSIGEALEKLRNLCSRQEKCSNDAISLLKRWGLDPEDQKTIIDLLKADKFVDDMRFARAFLKDKVKFDHWGIVKIRYYLQQKGIDKAICETVLGEINREEYGKMIINELKKKRKSVTGTPREIWAKIARYGSSRGYEMEFMQGYLDEIASEV